jgi:hypothetical protein
MTRHEARDPISETRGRGCLYDWSIRHFCLTDVAGARPLQADRPLTRSDRGRGADG